ncbi:MAG TPA: nitrate reductase cytochrome c-type subunit [Thermoanaerobaculia bacterium]|jgi:cytochrome c-type protein NapB
MKRTALLALAAGALALAAAWAADEEKPPAEPAKPTSDAELSLYPGSVFTVPDPAGFAWNDSAPGDNERLARSFPLAPPRVPHGIAEFQPITLRSNACLDCHALDAGADAPELPASHRTDLRRAPESVTAAVAGARWLCLSCHVPTSDARPLRANSAAPR